MQNCVRVLKVIRCLNQQPRSNTPCGIYCKVFEMAYYCLLHSITNGKYGCAIATPNMKIGEPYFHRSDKRIGLAEVIAIADKKSIYLLLNEKEKIDHLKFKTVSTQCSQEYVTSSTQCAVEYSHVSTQSDETLPAGSLEKYTFIERNLEEESIEKSVETPLNDSLRCDDFIGRNSCDDSFLDEVDITLKNINSKLLEDEISESPVRGELEDNIELCAVNNEIIQISDTDFQYDESNARVSEIVIEEYGENAIECGSSTDDTVIYDSSPKSILNEKNLSYNKESKFHWCYLCKKKIVKFARHMEDMHSKVEEVKNFMLLPKKDARRRTLIAKLRSYSDYQYNIHQGYANNSLIVSRRTKYPKDSEHFLPCPECKLLCEKTFLWVHVKKCKNTEAKCRTVQSDAKCIKMLSTLNGDMKLKHQFLPKVLSSLTDDDISHIIRKDETILNFGNFLCYVHSMKVNCVQIVRAKMRFLGRILREIQAMEPSIGNVKEIFNPKNFPLVLAVGRKLGKFNNENITFVHPSVAMEVGIILKKCAGVLENDCLINGDEDLKNQVDTFMKLLDINYGPLINRQALLAAKEAKFNKPEELPQVEDISRLMEFLGKLANDSYNDLNNSGPVNQKAFENLNKSVMISILLFNRKRTGETEKLLLSGYKNKQIVQPDSDLYRTLTEEEKKISSFFYRIEIRGKRDRKVPILLTKQMMHYVDTIIKFRALVGIDETNPYLFANCSVIKRFDACRAIRDLSELCGAKNPENLRGTKLRKQFATLMQVLKLTDNETQMLADFMGHHVEVHKSHYRKPDLVLQTGVVTKVLLAATDTNLEKYRGHNLETLMVSPDLLEKTNPTVERPYVEDQDTEPVIPQTQLEDYGLGCELQQTNFAVTGTAMYYQYQDNTVPDRLTQTPQLSLCNNVDEVCSNDPDFTLAIEPDSDSDISNYSTSRKRKRQCVRGPIRRRTWQSPEKKILKKEFENYIRHGTLPSLKECIKIRSKYSELHSRTSIQIKAWVNNENKRRNV